MKNSTGVSNNNNNNSAAENVYNKFKNGYRHIENPDYKENKIRIGEMKQNMIRELQFINTDMKIKASIKNENSNFKKKTNSAQGR